MADIDDALHGVDAILAVGAGGALDVAREGDGAAGRAAHGGGRDPPAAAEEVVDLLVRVGAVGGRGEGEVCVVAVVHAGAAGSGYGG